MAGGDGDDDADLPGGDGSQAVEHHDALDGPALAGHSCQFPEGGHRHGAIGVEGQCDDGIALPLYGAVIAREQVFANEALKGRDRAEAFAGFGEVFAPGVGLERGFDEVDEIGRGFCGASADRWQQGDLVIWSEGMVRSDDRLVDGEMQRLFELADAGVALAVVVVDIGSVRGGAELEPLLAEAVDFRQWAEEQHAHSHGASMAWNSAQGTEHREQPGFRGAMLEEWLVFERAM